MNEMYIVMYTCYAIFRPEGQKGQGKEELTLILALNLVSA